MQESKVFALITIPTASERTLERPCPRGGRSFGL